MKRDENVGDRRHDRFVERVDDTATTTDDGVSGAFDKKACETEGPKLTTARRIPADEMNRSIKGFETMKKIARRHALQSEKVVMTMTMMKMMMMM